MVPGSINPASNRTATLLKMCGSKARSLEASARLDALRCRGAPSSRVSAGTRWVTRAFQKQSSPGTCETGAASRGRCHAGPDSQENPKEVCGSDNRRVRSVAILGKRLDRRGSATLVSSLRNFRSAEFVSVYVRSPSITGPIADVQLTSVFDPNRTLAAYFCGGAKHFSRSRVW
jgi:hypothetical protein